MGFVSGAGLFSATLGEEGSSGMADGGAVAEDAEEADAVCDFSDLSDLSDLEERFIKFKNPPLLFFFSASWDSELFKERLRKEQKKQKCRQARD